MSKKLHLYWEYVVRFLLEYGFIIFILLIILIIYLSLIDKVHNMSDSG
jgi:hypothetical protein